MREKAEDNYSSSSSSYGCKRSVENYDDKKFKALISSRRCDQKPPNDIDESLNSPQSAFRENEGDEYPVSDVKKYTLGGLNKKHHRNIALETGRKGEKKESDDHDQPIKTVYPDSSRFNRATANGPDGFNTDKALEIKESLWDFSAEILDEAIDSLKDEMMRKIRKVENMYQKRIDIIKAAKQMKEFM